MKHKKVCIIDTGSSNLKSLSNMISFMGFSFLVSNKTRDLRNSDYLIIPGVGAFSSVMTALASTTNLESLEKEVKLEGKPTLGICVGMQIMNRTGFENGTCSGLGWLPGVVTRFKGIPAPHVGFNYVHFSGSIDAYSGDYYFTHSYKVEKLPENNVLGRTEYGDFFISAQRLDNIIGVQFHPEKSQLNGLKIMKYFLNL